MVMDIKKHIGDRIYDLRIEKELTQQEFVNRLNITYSRTNLSGVENGLINPSAEFIYSVCKTYNLSADWLLGLDESKHLTGKEKILLNAFKKLSPTLQQNILDLINNFVKGK